MDRTLEFIVATESFGCVGGSTEGISPSNFVLKAVNAFTQISMFENLLNSICTSYIGYNRFLPSTAISSPLSVTERKDVTKEILNFIVNISTEIKDLNRYLALLSPNTSHHEHVKRVMKSLVTKLQSFTSANDRMQKLHKQNNISPLRLMTNYSEANNTSSSSSNQDEYLGAPNSMKSESSHTVESEKTESTIKSSGFSSRYVDEIASQGKMNEYKSIAAKHKASLLKEAKVLQTRFNDDLAESIRMENEVNNISKLLAQFVVMIESQSEIVGDVNEFSKQSTATVKQAGAELQLTLERTQSHQWSMVLLILGFAVLLLALDVLTP